MDNNFFQFVYIFDLYDKVSMLHNLFLHSPDIGISFGGLVALQLLASANDWMRMLPTSKTDLKATILQQSCHHYCFTVREWPQRKNSELMTLYNNKLERLFLANLPVQIDIYCQGHQSFI